MQVSIPLALALMVLGGTIATVLAPMAYAWYRSSGCQGPGVLSTGGQLEVRWRGPLAHALQDSELFHRPRGTMSPSLPALRTREPAGNHHTHTPTRTGTRGQIQLALGFLSAERETSQLPDAAVRVSGPHTAVLLQHRGSLPDSARHVLQLSKIPVFPARDHVKLEGEIPLTLNDTADRVRWRSAHALDYAALLRTLVAEYPAAPYFGVLEDDLLIADNFSSTVLAAIAAHREEMGAEWGLLSLYNGVPLTENIRWGAITEMARTFCGGCGAVALVFRAAVVLPLAEYIESHCFELPVDMLIPSYLQLRRDLPAFEYTPSLAQHMGTVSTFRGNGKERARLKSPTFVYSGWQHLHTPPTKADSGFVGCYRDSRSSRDLPGLFDAGAAYSLTDCAALCSNYFFFGMQYGYECYCGNDYGRYGKVSDSKCARPCMRECKLPNACGGPSLNSIYWTGLTLGPGGQIDKAATKQARAHLQKVLC
eukprot:m.98037 g.98037  ORF g.98037 m.98037 type:complete len:480 (+) comp8686_c0_seq2:22-1461(+)